MRLIGPPSSPHVTVVTGAPTPVLVQHVPGSVAGLIGPPRGRSQAGHRHRAGLLTPATGTLSCLPCWAQ